MLDNRKHIWDDLLQLKDSGTSTTGSTGSYGTVDSSLATVNLGEGYTSGMFVVDVSAAYLGSPSTTQAKHTFTLKGGSVSSGAWDTPMVDLASITLQTAHATKVGFGLEPSATRNIATVPVRAAVPFNNERCGTIFPLVRVRYTTSGTTVTGCTYAAFVSKTMR